MAGMNFNVAGADPGTAADGTTGGPGTLSDAIAQINAMSASGGPYTITLTGNVTLSGPLPPILGSMTIDGNGFTIDAGGSTRIFFVGTDKASQTANSAAIIGQRQNVSIENVTLANGTAQGGAGTNGGGGGLGAGGAVFVNQTADVTLSGVTFSGDTAVGGAGATGFHGGGGGLGGQGGGGNGGGGGIFGNGNNGGGGVFGDGGTFQGSYGGGGGGFSGNGGNGLGNGGNGALSVFGLHTGGGNASGFGSSASGGANGGGGAGGYGGGGGGFGGHFGDSNSYGNGGYGGFGGGGGTGVGNHGGDSGGAGGFGGGGGGTSAGSTANGFASGGAGGFGGGGGGSALGAGGAGGFGGGGGSSGRYANGGAGGFATGTGGFGASAAAKGSGGGGAGLGGAVFVASGGTLTLSGDGTLAGTASGGVNGGGTAASAFGDGIFYQGTDGTASMLTIGDGDATISSTIADYVGSGGTNPNSGANAANQGGSVSLVKSGTGTLTLSAANTYTGNTYFEGGTIAVTNDDNLGAAQHFVIFSGGTLETTVDGFVSNRNVGIDGVGRIQVDTGTATLTGVIADGNENGVGTGALVKTGAGTLDLTNSNAYSLGTTVAAGTLALSGTASIHSSRKVALSASGAAFDISGATAGEVVNKLGGIAGTIADLGSQNLKIKVQSGTVDTFSGTIQDGGLSGGTGGSLTLGGTGELNLTAAESYTGATTLDAGTLALTGAGSIATSSGLSLQTSLGANSTFDISGETAASIGTLSGVAGSVIDFGAGTLTVTEASAGTFAGVIQNGGLSGGSGGSLVVAGAAALTLTGVETYTGRTSVSGILDLSGSASIQTSTKVALTKSGATLDISGETSGTVVQKLGGIAGTVTDLGSKSLKIKVKSGTVDTFSGTIKDGGVAGGSGGSITLGGQGELSLTGANNSYTGGTTLDAGTLDLAALGAAGSGTITFANPASNGVATLEIDAAALTSTTPVLPGTSQYDFANAIAGATSTNQVIDLRSLAYVQGSTSATLVGTTLNVNDGTSDVTLHLAAAQAKSSFTTMSDGHGGTLVYDPPVPKHTPATARIDTRWIEMAMIDHGGVAGDAHAHALMHDHVGMGAALPSEPPHGHLGKFVRGA